MDYIVEVWLRQIVLAIAIGVFTGYGARKALMFVQARKWVDKESFLGFAIALAVRSLST